MRTTRLITVAVLVNILFSYLMLLYRQPINPDGILYLHAASAYLQQGFHGALSVYPWPFYAVLIAKTSTLFHVSLLNMGYLLNSVFTSILVLFFMLALREIENSPTVLLWGAAVILLCPMLNHDRSNLVRDLGYYAFFMCSLWSYFKFLKTEKSSYGFVWQIALILATLFRIEGMVFLIITPFITKKPLNFLKLSGFTILLFLLALILFRHSLSFGRIPELISYMNASQLFNLFQTKAVALKSFLGVLGQDDSGIFLIGGLLGVLIAAFITTFGILSSLLLGYGTVKKLLPKDKSVQRGLMVYILINILILSVFLIHQLFMNWRYIFPLVLVCLLLLPAILVKLNKLWIGIIYLLYMTASSFGQFGPSNSYIVEAGNWVANNTPMTTKIYSTNTAIVFYAKRDAVSNQNQANYVIIVSKVHTPSPIPQTQPVASFHNHRGDTAYIFKSNT